VVMVLVMLMREVKIPAPAGIDMGILPPTYSGINVLVAIFLIAGLIFIKQKRIQLHQRMMTMALVLSVMFLLLYVAYHFTTPSTIYGDLNHDGELSAAEAAKVADSRSWYLVMLISHIGLAALSLPFILFTFIRSYTGQIQRHKKMARWVYPVWLYVAVTGPICYLMLLPYYP